MSTYDNCCWVLANSTNVILLCAKVFVFQLNHIFGGLSCPHMCECLEEGRCSVADPLFPGVGGVNLFVYVDPSLVV